MMTKLYPHSFEFTFVSLLNMSWSQVFDYASINFNTSHIHSQSYVSNFRHISSTWSEDISRRHEGKYIILSIARVGLKYSREAVYIDVLHALTRKGELNISCMAQDTTYFHVQYQSLCSLYVHCTYVRCK